VAEKQLPAADAPRPARDDGTPHSYIRELAARRSEGSEGDVTETSAVALLPAAGRLIDALVDAGVTTFFGIPGGPVSPVFDAILHHPSARLIESRHETCAAFAAADYQRASGETPAVVVTAGPGATNVITGVVSAHLERVPMIVICGDVAWSQGGRLLQDSGPEGIAIEQVLANATRATIRVARSDTAATQGIAALNAANNPLNPGPALLVLPIQRGRSPVARAPVARAPLHLNVPPPASAISTTLEWLLRAENPLLVVGAACRNHQDEVRRLVDALDIPFVTTPQAKGIISETHPRSLRHGGLAASMWARRYTAAGVDAALVLGTDLDDCSIGPTPYIKPTGKLVHVDLNAAVFGRNLPTALGVVANLGEFAALLADVLIRRGLSHGGSATFDAVRAQSPVECAEYRTHTSPNISPQRAVADLEAACPQDTAFITDIGEHMLSALHYLTTTSSDRFTIHLGLGSMGSGIGGAVGLALARPWRRVVCICGDGGMQMVGMEAQVALKYGLPIVYAVFNDARYNMVYHGYKQVFGREAAWDSPWTDFATWARSMGMVGHTVEHPGQINAELMDELTSKGLPVVLDIRIDRELRLQGGGRNEALAHMSALERGSV
jgi:acetolactate synthase I/II/III large subunit